jgi:signal transduction histidine kinase
VNFRAQRATYTSWAAVAAVAILCAILGFLQYHWIGEVSFAERGRLYIDLRFALANLSRAIAPLSSDQNLDQKIPALRAQYLATPALADYDLEIVTAGSDPSLVYASNPADRQVWTQPDAWEPIFNRPPGDHHDPNEGQFGRRGPPPDTFRGPPFDGRRGHEPERWRLLAHHRSGSLEALVASAQRRNLAVSAALLLLIFGIAAALVRLTQRAQILADAQIGFVAGVSHELRTPLTVIRTAAFNLTSGKVLAGPEPVQRYGRLIAAESEKLEGLIDQVLRFASGRAGHVIRELRPVQLAPLIEEVAAASGSSAITLKIQPDLPPVPCDDQALRHALRNLIDNAIRYGAGQEIVVSAKSIILNRFPHILIEVADSGPGIPPDEIDHVFDPFFRGKTAIRDQIHGTGLGLNIVRTIAEAHGGTVSVRSGSGGGAHFLFYLPCPENLSGLNRPDDENSAD